MTDGLRPAHGPPRGGPHQSTQHAATKERHMAETTTLTDRRNGASANGAHPDPE